MRKIWDVKIGNNWSSHTVEALFVEWMLEHCILYGQPFLDWWKEEGLDRFFTWARKKGLDFVNTEQLSNKK